jgi:PIN domain nuclease of toxin-antitoxin system
MKILLDTHALLWFIEGDSQLSQNAKKLIEDPKNEVYVSHISFFEISIKLKIGKLQLLKSLRGIYDDALTAGIELLDLEFEHIENYQSVPLIADHRDPFDRILIATALHENLSIITIDEKFENYKHIINVIW